MIIRYFPLFDREILKSNLFFVLKIQTFYPQYELSMIIRFFFSSQRDYWNSDRHTHLNMQKQNRMNSILWKSLPRINSDINLL